MERGDPGVTQDQGRGGAGGWLTTAQDLSLTSQTPVISGADQGQVEAGQREPRLQDVYTTSTALPPPAERMLSCWEP
jgi:hypothetical protein